MRIGLASRLMLLIAIHAGLALPAYSQQSKRCMLAEASSEAARRETARQVVPVESVRWNGGSQLPESARDELVASLRKVEYDAESDWTARIREQVRSRWQDEGFFKAEVDVQVLPVNPDEWRPVVSLAIRVEEGLQYRLGDLQFANENPDGPPLIFSSAVLRPLFPIQEGDILNVSKLRAGMEAVKKLYGSHGYLLMVMQPLIDFDDSRRRTSLRMVLQEGRQFTLESIRFLGLDSERQRRLTLRLQPGYVFNNDHFEEFFAVNQHLLPAGAGPLDVTFDRDEKTSTVRLTFDFRPCGETRSASRRR